MQLSKYDGQCVQIEDSYGDVFEGYCSHNSADYNEHEFGRNEEGLALPGLLLFKSDIKKITSLEDHQGPYGKFTSPYGKLEEITVEDGVTMIDEVLYSEEPEHIYRLLLCIEDHLKSPDDNLYNDSNGLAALLKNFTKMDLDAKTKEKVQALITRLKNQAPLT